MRFIVVLRFMMGFRVDVVVVRSDEPFVR